MIDTMFFLLVFFMIATLSMTVQKGMPVTLPTADSSPETVSEQISLTLTNTGKLFFNKEPIGVLDLGPRLQRLLHNGEEPAIIINADKAVLHGQVIEVMDAIRKTGMTKMAIATQPNTPS